MPRRARIDRSSIGQEAIEIDEPLIFFSKKATFQNGLCLGGNSNRFWRRKCIVTVETLFGHIVDGYATTKPLNCGYGRRTRCARSGGGYGQFHSEQDQQKNAIERKKHCTPPSRL